MEKYAHQAEPSRSESRGPDTWVSEPRPIIASDAMGAVYDTVSRVARSLVPVLIQGETGVGKEVIARAIHERGPRFDSPLKCINCGALPSQLIESTLFGHERGAFTSAERASKGIFESADGGTVLLDEIGELPLSAQAALLRVLETKHISRVGSSDEVPVDVRILAATHRDLEGMCQAGTFRWDLYFRLNVITINVPPLRERTEEVELLAEHFIKGASQTSTVREISKKAIDALRQYRWPGNVRELRNVIHRATVVCKGSKIELEDLPGRILRPEVPELAAPARRRPIMPKAMEQGRQAYPAVLLPMEPESERDALVAEPLDFKSQMQAAEAQVLLTALMKTSGNQTEAARRLRMPLRTLVHKIKLHGLRERLRAVELNR